MFPRGHDRAEGFRFSRADVARPPRQVRFVATGRPYRRPIRTTAISAISRGSLVPVVLTSITLRATISQSGSLRSTTPSKFKAWLKALFKSSISSGVRLSFNNRLIGIVPPLSRRKQNQTPSIALDFLIALDFRSRRRATEGALTFTNVLRFVARIGVKIKMATSVTAKPQGAGAMFLLAVAM